MTGNPPGSIVSIDGVVAVVHSRRRGRDPVHRAVRIGIDARLDPEVPTSYGLVDTTQSATIERLSRAGTSVLAFGSADPISIARAVRAGAIWHIADDVGFEQVATHLVRLAAGDIGPGESAAPPPTPAVALLDTLTRRESEVLRWLVSGRRAAEIADADFVSVITVRNQIQSILTKLGAHSQLEAVAIRGARRVDTTRSLTRTLPRE